MSEKNRILEFLVSKLGNILITIVAAVIIYGIFISTLKSDSNVISGITLIICAFFGWKSLDIITPQIFMFMNIQGWIIYFLVKGIISMLIGVFIAPFQIGRITSNYIQEYINTMR